MPIKNSSSRASHFVRVNNDNLNVRMFGRSRFSRRVKVGSAGNLNDQINKGASQKFFEQ
jgi:hypothetical protein